jgi:hypothetical protein
MDEKRKEPPAKILEEPNLANSGNRRIYEKTNQKG